MAYLLQHLLTESTARCPDRPAVATGGRCLTYQELDRLSSQVTRAFLTQGVAPGDRVGIRAPKSAASVVQDATPLPLGNTTLLLETDILDSLSMLRLVLFVQERFWIAADDVDLVPEHFTSVNAICAYLRSRAGERAGKASGYGDG
jgi:non-ribosomal peptide synthetase component F